MDYEIQNLRQLAANSSGVVYTPLCESEVSVPPPPRFIFGECTHEPMTRYYRETYLAAVGVYAAANIGVHGDALLVRGRTILACDEIEMNQNGLGDYISRYRAVSGLLRPRIEAGQCVLLLGRGYGIYGHWLVDFLPKLFLLHQAGYDVAKLRYLVPQNTPQFGLDMLELLGITAEKRILYHPGLDLVCPDQLLIPTMARTSSRPSPLFGPAVEFATDLIWQRHTKPSLPDGMQRIFISRSRSGRAFRCLLNRQQIERLAAEAGFKLIYPEQMPLLEQFALFGSARQVIGEYGSALHTAIFSKPGTTLGVLRGTGSEIAGFLQSGIGASRSLPTGYVFGPTVAGDPLESFSISETALQTCMNLIFSGTPLA